VDIWEHVGVVLEAMKGIAAELGLDGRLAAGTVGLFQAQGDRPEH
jgi:hypothetical protein